MLSLFLLTSAALQGENDFLFFSSKLNQIRSNWFKFLIIDHHISIPGNETNRDDLNSIESDFEDKLRATNFKSNLTINNLSLNQLKQLYLKHRIRGQLNFDLVNLFDKEYINSTAPSNRTIVYQTYLYVENYTPLIQTKYTIGFEKSVEKIDEFTFDRTFGFSISAGVEIKIPILKIPIGAYIKIDASFSEHEYVKKTTIERENVTASSQPVEVGPFSRVKVTYNVLQYATTLNNRLDFEVTPHAKGLFAFFLKKMGNAVYGQGDLKLEYLDGKAIMRNFPETEKLTSHGIEIVIGPEEKIPNVEVIQIV